MAVSTAKIGILGLMLPLLLSLSRIERVGKAVILNNMKF